MTSSPFSALWRRKPLLALLALVAFSAAAGAKPPSLDTKYTESYIKANLVVGKTTIAEVRERFGEPTSRDRNRSIGLTGAKSESEYWTYDRRDEKTKGSLFDQARTKLGGAASLFGGTRLGAAASKANYRGSVADVEVNSRVSGAKDLLGTEPAANPDQVIRVTIHFDEGVVDSVSY